MNVVTLGAGTMPDVTWTPSGWIYAWQPMEGASATVYRDYREQLRRGETVDVRAAMHAPYVQLSDGRRLLCGNGQLAFVRVGAAGGLAVAWRGVGNEAYLLRDALSLEATRLGPTGGNCPVALDGGVVAWQAAIGVTHRTRVSDLQAFADQSRWAPTGLCTARPLTYIDDVRLSVAGMTNPVRAGALVVGECTARGGVLCRLDDERELLLWPDEDTMTPRAAVTPDGTRFAVVTWGREGVRVALDLRPEDFGSLVEPAPPGEEEPVVLPPKVEGPNGTNGVDYTKEMKKGKEWTVRALFTSPVDEVRITIDAEENLTVTCRNAAGTGATGKRRLVAGRC